MQATLLDKDRIAAEWPDIADRLWPAVRQDPTYDLESLRAELIAGTALAFEVGDGAEGLWIVSLGEDNGLVAWTVAIAGRIEGGPKRRLAAMRDAVAALEQTLKTAGVRAHRICGRDWSKVLPSYSPYAGARNGLQKEL